MDLKTINPNDSQVMFSPAACSSRYQDLKIEVNRDGVALVTLNRAPVNAVTMRMHKELASVWRDLDADPSVKVILVTGSGRAFSAGGDFDMIAYTQKGAEQLFEVLKDTRELVHSMIDCSKPIVSAINGVAVGAGMAVAVCADISIASEKALFNDGHTRLGVAAGDHAVLMWPHLMSMARAKLYLYTGRFISAVEAERIGLVSLLVSHEKLMEEALKICTEIANGPQPAIRFTKESLKKCLDTRAFDYSCALEMLTFVHPDMQEGMKAIQAKRTARFPSATPQAKL